MPRRPRRRSSRSRPRDGILLDAADAPVEGADAGDDADLQRAHLVAQVRGYEKAARKHFQAAQQLAKRAPAEGEREARAAIDNVVRGFWWAEDSDLEQAQHELMHKLGRWTRRTFGCELGFNDSAYEHRCPIRIAHKRIGQSIGFTAKRICSICGDDLSECAHRKGRSYWIRGGPGPSGHCPVCLAELCAHRPDHLYRVSVVSIIKEAQLREVSFVGRPAQPEARLLALPIDTQELVDFLGPGFAVGMPVNCDACLGPCAGFDELDIDPAPSDPAP